MNFQPMGNKMIVEEIPHFNTNKIELVKGTGRPVIGEVKAVGQGRWSLDGTKIPLRFKVGDRVLYMEGAVLDMRVGGKLIHLIHDDDVFCLIDSDDGETR